MTGHISPQFSAFASAIALAVPLSLASPFAAARDNGWHGHYRGGPGGSVSVIRNPHSLMGGYSPRGINLGRDFRSYDHYHSHSRDFNDWPWVTGAAILGLITPRVYQIEPPPVVYYTPPYEYGEYRNFTEPSFDPLRPRPQRPAQVCFDDLCTPKTGEVILDHKVCDTTDRDGKTQAHCLSDGSVYTYRPN